jgi:ubiquinone/menaquinone biosynthesis C-methylase UbiE
MGRMLNGAGSRPGERVRALGPGSTPIVVDVQSPMISAVEKKGPEAGVANVETHVASAHDLSLGEESVDRALLVTALSKTLDRHRELPELDAVPGPRAVLAATEHLAEPDCQPAGTTIGRAREAGSELAEQHGHWFVHTLGFQRQG